MLNCKQATEMVIKQQFEKFGLMDRLNLFMHLSMCKFCNLFAKQNELIDASVRKLDDIELEHMSESSKTRIAVEIKK